MAAQSLQDGEEQIVDLDWAQEASIGLMLNPGVGPAKARGKRKAEGRWGWHQPGRGRCL